MAGIRSGGTTSECSGRSRSTARLACSLVAGRSRSTARLACPPVARRKDSRVSHHVLAPFLEEEEPVVAAGRWSRNRDALRFLAPPSGARDGAAGARRCCDDPAGSGDVVAQPGDPIPAAPPRCRTWSSWGSSTDLGHNPGRSRPRPYTSCSGRLAGSGRPSPPATGDLHADERSAMLGCESASDGRPLNEAQGHPLKCCPGLRAFRRPRTSTARPAVDKASISATPGTASATALPRACARHPASAARRGDRNQTQKRIRANRSYRAVRTRDSRRRTRCRSSPPDSYGIRAPATAVARPERGRRRRQAGDQQDQDATAIRR